MSITDFFNVFDDEFEPMITRTFGEARVEGRILYRSPDHRVLIVATRYPDGVAFDYGGSVDYHEGLYIAAGRSSRTFPDGASAEMRPGDLIYVHPGIEIDYVYGPGFADVAFFWSDAPLDPDLTAGLSRVHAGG